MFENTTNEVLIDVSDISDLNDVINNVDNENDLKYDDQTLLDDIKNSDINDYKVKLFDFSSAVEYRISLLKEFFDKYPEETISIINRFKLILAMSPTSLLKRFFCEICVSDLPADIRIDCASMFCEVDIKQGLRLLFDLKSLFILTPTPYRLERIIYLILNVALTDRLYNESIQLLYEFFNDVEVETIYRYRNLISLNDRLAKLKYKNKELNILYNNFINLNANEINYKILLCQYLLNTYQNKDSFNDINNMFITLAINTLTSYMNDESLIQRFRSDASDVLIHLCKDDEIIRQSKDVIMRLGGFDKNIFLNTENVHSEKIQESVIKCLKYLDSIELILPSLKTCITNITELCKKHELSVIDKEKVDYALLRISLDRTTINEINCTLGTVLCKVYGYVVNSHNVELEIRLLQELVDMADTCTSGYLSRLVNVLSGFVADYSLEISWADQIASNLFGRLNARIKVHPDRDLLLEQIISESYKDKKEFLNFFVKNLPFIKEEMYQEFKYYLSDDEWDENFKRALVKYDCV